MGVDGGGGALLKAFGRQIGGVARFPDDLPDALLDLFAGGFGIIVVDDAGHGGDGNTGLLCNFFQCHGKPFFRIWNIMIKNGFE